MITLYGKKSNLCDGLIRRDFLKIGGISFAGHSLGLAQILAAKTDTTNLKSGGLGHKAIINVFLGGGPPHQDMWDLKPDAPVEIRGEFKPISTSVPGIQIGETFPLIASRMHNCVVVRSIVGAQGGHDAVQCMSGWVKNSLSGLGGRPSIGAASAKIQGPVDPSVPAFIGLAADTKHMPWSDPGTSGFLGAAHKCFRPEGPGMKDLLIKNVHLTSLGDRRSLLKSFDNLKRN